MKSIEVTIPTPCHENWQTMSLTEQGRFCSSCKKEVIDFTVMDDKEIVRHLTKVKGEACGSFLPNQLDRSFAVPKQSSSSWKYFFQILLPAFLFSQKPQAQTIKPSALQTVITKPSVDEQVIIMGRKHIVRTPDQIINGVITDSATNQPIPFATIKIKDDINAVNADSTGVFALPMYAKSKKITLVISCVGYKTREVKLKSLANLQTIKLIKEEMLLGEIQIMGYQTIRCRRTTGGYSVWTKKSRVKKITDSLTGKNIFNIYPNPVRKNSLVNIGMNGVQKGEYLLQLIDTQGQIVQQDKIEVPDTKYIFQLTLKNEIVSGNYFLRIISPGKILVHNGKIIVE